jgi:two-component system, NarL family, sensor histidine kinase DesK
MSNEAAGVAFADHDGADRIGVNDEDLLGRGRNRRLLLIGIIAAILVSPASDLLRGHLDGREWYQPIGIAAMIALATWALRLNPLTARATQWLGLGALLGLAIAMFVLDGAQSVGLLAVASGLCGRFCRRPLPVALTATACALAALVVSELRHEPSGDIVPVVILPPVAALLGYTAGRRIDAMAMLRRTRAELARAAVAEERLRIARDLHDLLGHSLSLITLKAELAGRVLPAEPERAAREIADVQAVARQSLSDVRAAVAGFRQPDLAAELVSARQLLDAAGISSSITSPGPAGLSPAVDAALAWAVREGTTNAVRHSKAKRVVIRVSAGPTTAVAEISDDGPAAPAGLLATTVADRLPHAEQAQQAAGKRTRSALAGSGLAGLADRVRELGGEIAAGAVRPHGFQLRVVVPLRPQAS